MAKYFYEIKEENKEWECPQKAFYSFLSGVMNYAYFQDIYDKKLKRRVVVVENKVAVEVYEINSEMLRLWFENRLQEKRMDILVKFTEELLYLFEVKKVTKEDNGNLFIQWENPAGVAFSSPFYVWSYIIRNAENFYGKEKRIKTVKAGTGEMAYATSIEDSFIKNMENSRNFLKNL